MFKKTRRTFVVMLVLAMLVSAFLPMTALARTREVSTQTFTLDRQDFWYVAWELEDMYTKNNYKINDALLDWIYYGKIDRSRVDTMLDYLVRCVTLDNKHLIVGEDYDLYMTSDGLEFVIYDETVQDLGLGRHKFVIRAMEFFGGEQYYGNVDVFLAE